MARRLSFALLLAWGNGRRDFDAGRMAPRCGAAIDCSRLRLLCCDLHDRSYGVGVLGEGVDVIPLKPANNVEAICWLKDAGIPVDHDAIIAARVVMDNALSPTDVDFLDAFEAVCASLAVVRDARRSGVDESALREIAEKTLGWSLCDQAAMRVFREAEARRV